MRVLPCDTCGQATVKSRFRATNPREVRPYVIGGVPNGIERHALRYKCATCKRTTTLTVAEFMALPLIGLDDLRLMGLADIVLKDLLGAGFTEAQAQLASDAGVRVEEMRAYLEAHFP